MSYMRRFLAGVSAYVLTRCKKLSDDIAVQHGDPIYIDGGRSPIGEKAFLDAYRAACRQERAGRYAGRA